VYIQEIVNTETMNKNFFHSLMEDFNVYNVNLDKKEALEAIKNKFIEIGNVEKITLLEEAVEGILDGKCVFLISGISAGLSLNTSKWQHRSIGEPISEAVVRGPSESFTEAISINISLIRKRLKTHNLKMEKLEIGHLSRTRVVMSYIKGVACEKVVNEARKRLEKKDIDSINDSGEIEQFIEDNPYSPFPQISYTERPDIVSACLSDGKVAVLVDGSPLVLVFPAVFVDFLSSPEDYYVRFYFGTFIRMLRYIAFVIALFLPSIAYRRSCKYSWSPYIRRISGKCRNCIKCNGYNCCLYWNCLLCNSKIQPIHIHKAFEISANDFSRVYRAFWDNYRFFISSYTFGVFKIIWSSLFFSVFSPFPA
ncbi:MAG TPA: spore germination protein, partial [Acetivibrio saccincola]|nr:spore germination protein [Acetivibrio saccincola]